LWQFKFDERLRVLSIQLLRVLSWLLDPSTTRFMEEQRETMASGRNRFPRVLLVFAVVIFGSVTSNIDDGSFNRNNYDRFDTLYQFSHVCNQFISILSW